jgi:5-methylcytosine-specific restriction endonuclease McrA
MAKAPRRQLTRIQRSQHVAISPARKQTTTERGYGWHWQQVRLGVLRNEPLCRFCSEQGLVVVAAEVDHIDGNSHNNDLENLRPLCRVCHLRRTAEDQAFGKMMWRPNWLKPSLVPLHIVCGPPASGKSYFVRRHAGPNDLVMDLDEIASKLSGQPGHSWDRVQWLTPAIRARNEMLGDIARRTDWPAAWLVVSEAKGLNRQWWADTVKPERIVLMTTPKQICVQRARLDADRNQRGTEMIIEKWFANFTSRRGDELVSS